MTETEWTDDVSQRAPRGPVTARPVRPAPERLITTSALVLIALGFIGAGAIAAGHEVDWWVAVGLACVGLLLLLGIVWTTPAGYAAVSGINPSDVGWVALNAESSRARRYDRSFVVLLVPRGNLSTAERRNGRRDAYGDLRTRIERLLRPFDHVWVDDGDLYVLLSECDATRASAFVDRARAAVPDIFTPDGVRQAQFPGDAVTVGGLIGALHEVQRRAPALSESGLPSAR